MCVMLLTYYDRCILQFRLNYPEAGVRADIIKVLGHAYNYYNALWPVLGLTTANTNINMQDHNPTS